MLLIYKKLVLAGGVKSHIMYWNQMEGAGILLCKAKKKGGDKILSEDESCVIYCGSCVVIMVWKSLKWYDAYNFVWFSRVQGFITSASPCM